LQSLYQALSKKDVNKAEKIAGLTFSGMLNLKHMKRNITLISFLVILTGLVLWMVKNDRSTSSNINSGKLSVVASFYPLYFFASEIGGDKAQVINITPAGAEPHDFEPTPQDLVKMESSRLIVLNGGGLETWQKNVEKNINPKNTQIVVAGEGLTMQQATENGQGGVDPHVWLSSVLAQKMVDKIAQSFVQVDPVSKDYYNANAAGLKNKLMELDAQYRNGLKSCAKKDIITAHSAFAYLAAEYGFKQVSIAGLSPDAEPSSSQLASLAKFAKDNGVKYIFFESLASPKLAETLASEIGAQTLVLDPLEGLSTEDMSRGKNYLTVMQDNLTNLRTALECQ